MGLIIALVAVLLLSAAVLAALLFRRRRRQKQVDQVCSPQSFLDLPSYRPTPPALCGLRRHVLTTRRPDAVMSAEAAVLCRTRPCWR